MNAAAVAKKAAPDRAKSELVPITAVEESTLAVVEVEAAGYKAASAAADAASSAIVDDLNY